MRKLSIVMSAAFLLACSDTAREEAQSEQSSGFTGSAEDAAANRMDMSKQVAGIGAAALQDGAAPPADPLPDRPAATQGTASQVAPSMLIRTGAASIEVERLDPAIIKVRQLAAQLGGYVANSSISGGRDQIRSATLELKIPAARYDQAVTGLGGIGRVESVNTNVEDVGEEFVDISARVANSKRLEERLVGLLATRTGRLEDVLAVERELARVREEIERYEGRIRFLRTRAAVSTLSVTVHEPAPLLGQHPGENPILGALKQAWRNFVGFIAWIIASLGVLIPVAIIAAGGWYVYRTVRSRK
ncbi:MAG: DUF4349 domain-containing protein [Gemmatimonadaceae bacterium]